MLTTTDKLLGPTRLTDEHITALWRSIDRPDAKDYEFVRRLRHWAAVAGVDDANALSQMLWETDNMRAWRWNNDLNPAGIGITSDGTVQPFDLGNVDESARVLVQAIYAMVRKQWHPDVPMPAGARSWMDGVWLPKVRDPNYPKQVDEVRDQNIIYSGNRATWAVDSGYLSHVDRLNRFIPGVPDQERSGPVANGRTPFPAFDDRPLPDKFGAGMTYAARHPLVGSFGHTMVGWLDSTDGYFRQPGVHAATDYGIGGSGDGAKDGKIYRWIDYQRRRNATPWASGWESAPDYDTNGREYVQKFGVRAVNSGAVSIELSGLVATPMSVKQWASYIHLLAAIHHNDLEQGWEEFNWHMHHRDVAEKDCPFPRVYAYSRQYMDAVVQIMRHFETGADIPETVQIAGLVVPLPRGGGVITPPANPLFISFGKHQVFHTVPGARSRQYGSLDATIVRTYPKRTALRCSGYYVGQEVHDDPRWLLITSTGPSNAARIHASVVEESFNEAGIIKE